MDCQALARARWMLSLLFALKEKEALGDLEKGREETGSEGCCGKASEVKGFQGYRQVDMGARGSLLHQSG